MLASVNVNSLVILSDNMIREPEAYTLDGSADLALSLALYGYDPTSHAPIKVKRLGNRYQVISGLRRVSVIWALNAALASRQLPHRFHDITVNILD